MTMSAFREARIEADPNLPTITITRDFDAPPEKVFRAMTELDLVKRWMGPNITTMEFDEWDARTGGCFRYKAFIDGNQVASFYGSFHEVRPSDRIVQTFTFEGFPDGVSLETMTLEPLEGGRTRVVGVSIVYSMEDRDAMLASGMEVGIHEGYAKMDELLKEL